MKKFFKVIGTCFLMLLFMASCNDAKKEKDNTNAETQKHVVDVKKEIKTGRPSVIDFYATWCGPCKAIAPHFHELEKKYSSEINFMSVDVDQQPDVASEYDVQSVPTFIFLNADGSVIDRFSGAIPDSLDNKIKRLLNQ